ncbi:MAG: hypothetical protein QOI42_2129 [Frankiaceae bacterium]|nr:hypothetical protein [Frankiaceae bacterium]
MARSDATRARREPRLDQPRDHLSRSWRPSYDSEAFGKLSERFARFLGTAKFLIYMTMFVAAWLAWNWTMPQHLQFDPRDKNFTLLTLILSLQASYAAPLILLAQNRQADRDRVQQQEDRIRNERSVADMEYLAREVASIRFAMENVATRDFIRDQLGRLMPGEGDGEERKKEKKDKPRRRDPVT